MKFMPVLLLRRAITLTDGGAAFRWQAEGMSQTQFILCLQNMLNARIFAA